MLWIFGSSLRLLSEFRRREEGQDLVEYTLLLAFIVVTSAALLLTNQDAIAAIWGITTNNLEKAKSMSL